MERGDFVKAIKENVRDSAISSTVKNLTKPTGRRPSQDFMLLSQWFNGLAESDKEILTKAIARAVDQSVFGFFAVIDGVRTVEDSLDKGKFELFYTNNSIRRLLNDEQDEYLHDIYKQLISNDGE